jgi:hypothetical protein
MEDIENLNGVDYSINSNDLIIDDVVNSKVHDDTSGATGNIASTDNYFNDDMVSVSQELNQILAS